MRYDLKHIKVILEGIYKKKSQKEICNDYFEKFGSYNEGNISNTIKDLTERGFIKGEKYKKKELTDTGKYYLDLCRKIYHHTK
jgi:repressor of nif and glnA expression